MKNNVIETKHIYLCTNVIFSPKVKYWEVEWQCGRNSYILIEMTNLPSNVTFSGQLQQIFLFIELWDGLTLAFKQSKDRRNMTLSLCPLGRLETHL